MLSAFLSCTKSDNNVDIPVGYEYPVASFSYTGNDGPAPVQIQFTNTSETIIADSCIFTWTFGENGPSAHDKNPVHTFYNATNSEKVFLVSLEVHDLVSDLIQRRSIAITVKPSL